MAELPKDSEGLKALFSDALKDGLKAFRSELEEEAAKKTKDDEDKTKEGGGNDDPKSPPKKSFIDSLLGL